MKDWGKIAVAVRVGSACDAEFFRCWTKLLSGGLRSGDRVLNPATEMPHHYAANFLANNFLTQTTCDSILFIDDDICFSTNAVEKMRTHEQGMGYDIQMGLALSRTRTANPVIAKEEVIDGQKVFRYWEAWPKSGVVDVAFTGLAFTLIRREVFEGTPCEANQFFSWDTKFSEDANFTYKARNNGFKLCVNCDVRVGHRVKTIMYPDGDCDVSYAINWEK